MIRGSLLPLWSSLVGKFRARDALLNAVPWRGDEQVLDVGCGHGLMLIGAAKRLSSGRAIGIDIWQDVDQANNSAAATRRNAELEGVSVDVRNGDARRIPFDGAAFDVVVSSLVLHNIYDAREREQAMGEMARVLKPGGHSAIFDVRHAYARFFERNGFTIVKTWTTMLFARPPESAGPSSLCPSVAKVPIAEVRSNPRPAGNSTLSDSSGP